MGAWVRAHLGDGWCLNGWKLSTLETVLGVLAVCPQAVEQWKNCMSALHMS